jgi:hypothetical protein
MLESRITRNQRKELHNFLSYYGCSIVKQYPFDRVRNLFYILAYRKSISMKENDIKIAYFSSFVGYQTLPYWLVHYEDASIIARHLFMDNNCIPNFERILNKYVKEYRFIL